MKKRHTLVLALSHWIGIILPYNYLDDELGDAIAMWISSFPVSFIGMFAGGLYAAKVIRSSGFRWLLESLVGGAFFSGVLHVLFFNPMQWGELHLDRSAEYLVNPGVLQGAVVSFFVTGAFLLKARRAQRP